MNILIGLLLAIMWVFVLKGGVNRVRVVTAILASILIIAVALSWSVLGPLVAHIAFQMHFGG